MSLILKGIDLDTDYGLCILTKSGELITANGKNIQAIQLSKGHGKIVDLDDLVVKYWDGNSMEIDNEAYDNAPTILEAEE